MSLMWDDSLQKPAVHIPAAAPTAEQTAATETPDKATTGDGILRNPDRSHPAYAATRASLENIKGDVLAFLRSDLGLRQRKPVAAVKKGASA